MTACLYFSPWNHPALLADTLVTSSASGNSMPTPGSKITQSTNIHRQNAYAFARKIEIFRKRTALSAAGDEDSIMKYFSSCDEIIRKHVSRPTKALAEEAGKYNNSINVIGAYVPLSVEQGFHHIIPNSSKKIVSPKLGTYFAIGSGTSYLRKLAHRYNDSIASRKPRYYNENPYEIIREISENACADILNEETLGGDIVKSTWGGFAEYAFFNNTTQEWQYGPPRANFFFDCFILPSKKIVCLLSNRAVFYKPDEDSSYVCAVTRQQGGAEVTDWILESVIKRGRYLQTFNERWDGWKPLSANFSFNLYTETGVKRLSFCNELYEWDKFFAYLSDDNFGWGLDPDYMEQVAQKVAKRWGRHSVNAKDLSSEEVSYLSNVTTLI